MGGEGGGEGGGGEGGEDTLMQTGAEVSREEADLAASAITGTFDSNGDGGLDTTEPETSRKGTDKQSRRVQFEQAPEPEVISEESEPENQGETQRAGQSKGVIKRLKREAFLARVRDRRTARSPQNYTKATRKATQVVPVDGSTAQPDVTRETVEAAS